MDPDKALEEIEAAQCRLVANGVESAKDPVAEPDLLDAYEYLVALRDWLGGGGFSPNWARYPKGTEAFVRWLLAATYDEKPGEQDELRQEVVQMSLELRQAERDADPAGTGLGVATSAGTRRRWRAVMDRAVDLEEVTWAGVRR